MINSTKEVKMLCRDRLLHKKITITWHHSQQIDRLIILFTLEEVSVTIIQQSKTFSSKVTLRISLIEESAQQIDSKVKIQRKYHKLMSRIFKDNLKGSSLSFNNLKKIYEEKYKKHLKIIMIKQVNYHPQKHLFMRKTVCYPRIIRRHSDIKHRILDILG